MFVYTLEYLENQGVAKKELKQAFQIKCFEKIFTRSHDFPKKFSEKAIELCKAHISDGLLSFISEGPFSLTVWREKTEGENHQKSSQQNQFNRNKIESSIPNTLSNSQIHSSKNVATQVVTNKVVTNHNYTVSSRTKSAETKQEINNNNLQPYQYRRTFNNTPHSSIEDKNIEKLSISHKLMPTKKAKRTYRGIQY